jgi:class 3 adenylate cyclase
VTESQGRTLVCSVLFLDIVEYSKKPVADQLQLKQAFNAVLAQALEQVAPRDRIILDTGDGAAVTFMGDPEDALFASMAVRDLAGPIPIRLGVNLGPVRLVKDLNDQMNIIGDGINVAQRVMSFAQPGQLLVSRSFFEVVACLSRDYQRLFQHEGARTDKHVREHEVYSVVGGTPTERKVAASESQVTARANGGSWLAAIGPYGLRRSSLVAAPLVFLAIIAGGAGARAVLDREPAEPAKRSAAPFKSAVAAVEPQQPLPPKRFVGHGRVELAVAPWGEVLVDGRSRGVSPPLRVLDISAGSHTIEIRNSTFPSYVERVEVKTGQAVKIRHRFR